jgi:FAD/FMN-containing dehydrogenase
MEINENAVEELKKIVGNEHVSIARADLYTYSQDMTDHEPGWPDMVVMPHSVEEVQEVLCLATKDKIPITPYTAGLNIGGLTIPLKGGIVLDLRRMNRLIEFNEQDRYITVEPGFTFGDLRRFLDKECPHLWYSFPLCPPSTSILSNAILIGFGYEMNSLGTNYDNTNGIEVVLPTGEVVRIGSCSVSPYWFNRAPLPDLAGLFVGWQGATGVVTKIALQLWPRRPHSQQKFLITTGIRPTCTFIQKLGQTRACDEVWAMPYDMTQADPDVPIRMVLSEERTSGTYDRSPGPDMFTIMLVIEADTEDELKARAALLDVIKKEELKDTQFTEMPPQPFDLSIIPDRGIAARLGGLTWVGTMGPTSQWPEALEKIFPVFDKHRLLRIVSIGPFRGAHYGMLRMIVAFNKNDPDEVERVKKCMRESLLLALDTGFIPYKAPYWAVEEMMRRGDPAWVDLLIRVKRMLDPSNIMNPGRYGDTRG